MAATTALQEQLREANSAASCNTSLRKHRYPVCLRHGRFRKGGFKSFIMASPARAPPKDSYATLKARSLARYQAAAKAASGGAGGLPEMSADAILASILENDGYETPEVSRPPPVLASRARGRSRVPMRCT